MAEILSETPFRKQKTYLCPPLGFLPWRAFAQAANL